MKIKVNNKKAPVKLLENVSSQVFDQVGVLKRIEKLEKMIKELQVQLNKK